MSNKCNKAECPVVISAEVVVRRNLIKEIMDWQVDLQIDVSRIEDLENSTTEHLLDMLSFYEDTLKNGKRL